MWSRLFTTSAGRNVLTSYLAFASLTLWGLLTIPLAVAYLPKEELGIWSIVSTTLAYLTWMDLGVSNSTGRLMAKAISGNQEVKINEWWSTIQTTLMGFSLGVIALGVVALPLVQRFIGIPPHLQADFTWLFLGGVVVTATTFLTRSTPGLMFAEDRMHWIYLGQAVTPWINLGVFYVFLQLGSGLLSYLYALVAAQGLTMAYYCVLVRSGQQRPYWRWRYASRERLRELLGYSSNVSVVGFIDSFLQSLPLMLIGRLGGLALVPVYNFSSKGPLLATSLITKTHQSFFPRWVRLYVENEICDLRSRHLRVGLISIGVSIMGAAAVLAVNPVFVSFLSEKSFYAGSWTNIWFAVGMVAIPMSRYFYNLIITTGILGPIYLMSIAKLLVGVPLAFVCWRFGGMASIAALFFLLPLVNGIYGYFFGSKHFDSTGRRVSTRVCVHTCCAMVVVASVGISLAMLPTHFIATTFLGRAVVLPDTAYLGICSLLLLLGGVYTRWAWRRADILKDLPSDLSVRSVGLHSAE